MRYYMLLKTSLLAYRFPAVFFLSEHTEQSCNSPPTCHEFRPLRSGAAELNTLQHHDADSVDGIETTGSGGSACAAHCG